jgi:alanine dehydrogenase
MRIGVPTEIKVHEYRVGMTPAGVKELAANGHEVWVQRGAGAGVDLDDAAYHTWLTMHLQCSLPPS